MQPGELKRAAAAIFVLVLLGGGFAALTSTPSAFRFALLGDRTGEAVPGIYEEAWRETNLEHPDFVVTVGDTIQGSDDLTMDAQWKSVLSLLAPYQRYRIFFAPGNHDIWSLASAQAFEKYTKHPPHYSFDYKQAHFTILDNSRSDSLPAEELAYLDKDLQLHSKQPVKFVFSHRPSWILNVVLGDTGFPLHKLAKHYGVKYVIAGHLHQMLHFELEGVTYLSMASAGGHLRNEKEYEKGWFFAHTLVNVDRETVRFNIEELRTPYGQARATTPANWGVAGLTSSR